MLNKFFSLIQNNSWGLIRDVRSAKKAAISILIIILSVLWIRYALNSNVPKKPDSSMIKAGLQKYQTQVPPKHK